MVGCQWGKTQVPYMDACVVVHMHTGQLYDDQSRCEPSLAHNTVHVSVDEQIDFCYRAAH
jgi:hypothetical protein